MILVKTIWNAAPGFPNLKNVDEILSLADIVCVNENEVKFFHNCQICILFIDQAEFLANCSIKSADQLNSAINSLMKRGAKCVVVTLGAKGCCYMTSGQSSLVSVPAFKTTPVDTLVQKLNVFTVASNNNPYRELAIRLSEHQLITWQLVQTCLSTTCFEVHASLLAKVWRKLALKPLT